MSRRPYWTTPPDAAPRNDIMLAGPARFASEKDLESALEKESDDDSPDEDDWVSEWQPPSLNALSLLMLAGELDAPERRKPN